MPETEWTLPLADGKRVYGRTIHAVKPSGSSIVFVHGLTCEIGSWPYLAAGRSFAKLGYDVHLFNLYDWREGARRLSDCTLKIHAADLDRVLGKKTREHDKVFLIGHSYGGPTILHAKCRQAAAVSLWDPSYNIADWWPQWTCDKNGLNFFHGATDILMPDALNAEALTLDLAACRKLGKAFGKPMQVIHAGQGILYKYGESYHTHSRKLADYALIQDADHCFTWERPLRAAIRKTHAWFERCL